jgi:hypothetical protein
MKAYTFDVELDNGDAAKHTIAHKDLKDLIEVCLADACINTTIKIDNVTGNEIFVSSKKLLKSWVFFFGYGFNNQPIVEPDA